MLVQIHFQIYDLGFLPSPRLITEGTTYTQDVILYLFQDPSNNLSKYNNYFTKWTQSKVKVKLIITEVNLSHTEAKYA